MRPSSSSPCCRSPHRCRPPRRSPCCRRPSAVVAVPPTVVVVPPPLSLSPPPWRCAPVLRHHTSPYRSLSSAVVLHLTTPCFHPASSCLQRRLGVLWWLVVVPGSSSLLCPLAVACTCLPPCEQLLIGCWVGPSWLSSLSLLWLLLWLLSLIVPSSLSLFSPVFHHCPCCPSLSGRPRHLPLDLWLSSSSSSAFGLLPHHVVPLPLVCCHCSQ